MAGQGWKMKWRSEYNSTSSDINWNWQAYFPKEILIFETWMIFLVHKKLKTLRFLSTLSRLWYGGQTLEVSLVPTLKSLCGDICRKGYCRTISLTYKTSWQNICRKDKN